MRSPLPAAMLLTEGVILFMSPTCRSGSDSMQYSSAEDACKHLPADRFEFDAIDAMNSASFIPRFGSVMESVEMFEATAFRISEAEMEAMDPQQRCLLEAVLESNARGGLHDNAAVHTLHQSMAHFGVFVGAWESHYAAQNVAGTSLPGPHTGVGGLLSVVCGRVSYMFGMQGPSMCVDTACSASLVATHIASVALADSECDQFVSAGVSISVGMFSYAGIAAASMSSTDGRCKTLDILADGYGKGECCGVVQATVPKAEMSAETLNQSALLIGSAVNQDGRSSSLTAPNGPAQQVLIANVLSGSRINPNDVDHLEMHGTGTSLGDPIEVGAALNVLRRSVPFSDASSRDALVLEAAKTRAGHCEPGAGVIGIFSAIEHGGLHLTHGLPNLRGLNPHVESVIKGLAETYHYRRPCALIAHQNVYLVSGDRTKPRTCGVSGFAFQGTNAHVLVRTRGNEPAPRSSSSKLISRAFERKRYWIGIRSDHSIRQVNRVSNRTHHSEASLFISIRLSPVLADMFDHGVHGHAILPGTAHVEFGRGAIVQANAARPAGETGICSVVFSAPLALTSAGIVQCRVDTFGQFQLLAPSVRDRRRARAGLRSSGKSAAIQNTVVSGVTDRVSARVASTLDMLGIKWQTRMSRTCGEACCIQVIVRGYSPVSVIGKIHKQNESDSTFDVSPAALDAALHLAYAKTHRESRRRHLTRVQNTTATSPIGNLVRVPAALQAVVARGMERQYVSAWSAVSAESTDSDCQQKTLSTHWLWSSSRASSVCANINGLESRAMRQPVHRLNFKYPPASRTSREMSLVRTMYFCEWQSGGGLAHHSSTRVRNPCSDINVDVWPKLATIKRSHLKPLSARLLPVHSSPDTAIALSTMSVPRQSAVGLVELLQGARSTLQAMPNHGIHIHTCNGTSAAHFESCMPLDVCAGALSRGALGVTRSSMQEGGLRGDMSFSDSGARQRSPDSLDGLVRADDRLGVRQAGAVLTERLVAGCAATCKTQSCDGLLEQNEGMVSVSGHSMSRGRHRCVVTGGLGGLGGLAASWLFQSGSRMLQLTGRSGRTPMKPQAVLSSQFGYLRCIQSDVGCSEGANHRVGRSSKRAVLDPLVLGLVHSGGALFDAPTSRHCLRTIRTVWAGKASGASRLLRNDTASADATKWQSQFSSVAALIGSPAQCMYSAANAFLDAASECMRRQGRPGSTIQWGAWAASGMATKSAQTLSRWSLRGHGCVSPESGLAALGMLLDCSCIYLGGVVGVSPISPGALASASFGVDSASRMREYCAVWPAKTAQWSTNTGNTDRDGNIKEVPHSMSCDHAAKNNTKLIKTLMPNDTDGRSSIIPSPKLVRRDILQLVSDAIRCVAGRGVHEDAPLMEEGLDSLSAVELGNALQDTVGIPMPATLVFDYPSATAIVTYIQSASKEAPCVVDVSDDKKRGAWLEPCHTTDNHSSSSDKECPASFRKVLGYDARETRDCDGDAPIATSGLNFSFSKLFSCSYKFLPALNSSADTFHSPVSKLRYLSIHPFGSSGPGFCRQLVASQWIPNLQDICEFYFIDAMFPVVNDLTKNCVTSTESYQWFDSFQTVNWFHEGDKSSWMLEQSMSQIAAIVENFGSFDGVLGFSQGAMLTSVLAAMIDELNKGKKTCVGGENCLLIVLVSGMQLWDQTVRSVQDGMPHNAGSQVLMPSLHISSIGDKIIPSALSKRACYSNFLNPTFILHEYGHVMPRLSGHLHDDIRQFFLSHTRRHLKILSS